MKKGFALITVLAVLIMIALGTATILKSVGSQTDMKSNNVQELKTQYLAEAGMQYALWQCRQPTGCAGNPATISVVTPNDVAIDVSAPPKIVVTVNYTNV